MHYQELLPHPDLQTLVKCYWVLEAPCEASAHSNQRIVPDGRMELIFHYGNPFRRMDPSRSVVQPRGIIAGQIHAPLLIGPSGRIGIIAARFSSHGFSSLFRIPASEFSGRLFSITEVLGRAGRELQERILEARSHEQRHRILEAFLLSKWRERGFFDFRVQRAVQRMSSSPERLSILELSNELNISARQLERLFQQDVGLSPALYARILRFQRAISVKLNDKTLSLTALAHASGYYDQAHFIKDFKTLSGLSPGEYFREVHPMADLFTDEP